MELKTYVKQLLNYWWLIVSAAIIAMATTYIVARAQPPMYQTQATLVVGNMMYETNPTGNDIYLGQQLADYYAKIGMQGDVRKSTQEALGMNWLPQYSIIHVPNSQLIEIVVNDSDPVRAQAVANELATQLIYHSPTSDQQQDSDQQAFIDEQVAYLEERILETLGEIEDAERMLSEINSAQEIADMQTEITAQQAKLSQLQSNYAALLANTERGAINVLSIIEPAALPTNPIGPGNIVIVLIAGGVAAGIGVAAAYLIEFLDDTVKSSEEISQLLSLPSLGVIPKGKSEIFSQLTSNRARGEQRSTIKEINLKWQDGAIGESEETGLLSTDSIQSPLQPLFKEFQVLRMNLDHLREQHSLNSLLVTSPSPTEGKSLVAFNLALAMAQSGKKVILMDFTPNDWDKSKGYIKESRPGIHDVLVGTVDIHDLVHPWQENISFVDAGIQPDDAINFSNGEKFQAMITQLRKISDLIIIDGECLSSTNALEISTKIDGVLVVLRYGFTRRGTAETQVEKLKKVGANIIGVVLNNVGKKHME